MTSPPLVLGVDPGARYTGLALVRGTDLERARVIDRDRHGIDAGDLASWVRCVLEAVADDLTLGATVAVENLTPPTGFAGGRRRPLDPGVLIGTAAVLGAVVARFDAIVVANKRNGAAFDAAYPAGIRRGTRGLGGPPDHARSAYDVALLGAQALRFPARPRT